MLWQGQRQGRAEGGASTLQLFNLLLFSVRIAKATCPSDTPSTMVGKWGQHCEPAGGLMLSWARASRDGWLRSSPHTPRTTEPRSFFTTRSSSGCRHPCCFPRRQYGPSRCTRPWRRMTTHTLTGPSRPRLALLRRRDHGVLGWRPLRFTTRPSSRPPTRRSHGRGTGVLAPRRLASPQSLSCAIQHVYSLVPQRRRRLLFLSILTGIGTM